MSKFFFFCTLLSFGLLESVLAQDKVLANEGLSVYKTYYCGLCHQNTVAGTQGIFGPPHNAVSVISQARILDPNYSGNAVTVKDYLCLLYTSDAADASRV